MSPSAPAPRHSTLRRTAVRGAAVLLAWGLLPSEALAQACLGSAALRGEYLAGAMIQSGSGLREYRAEAGANLEGPLAFRSSVGVVERDGSDERGFVGAGTGLWETGIGRMSICPIGGFRHATWTEDHAAGLASFDTSELSFPAGLGAGLHLGEGGAIRLVPSLGAGVVLTRLSTRTRLAPGDLEDGDLVEGREVKTEVGAYLTAGAGLSMGRALLRADWAYSTRDRFDSILSVHLGIRFWSQEATRRVRD